MAMVTNAPTLGNDAASSNAKDAATSDPPKTKRIICSTCHRPSPRACICEALPAEPLILKKCRVLVLQHPHEARRKNRSLPLVELCLNQEQKQLQTVVARRFGDQVDPQVMELLQDPQKDLLLVFPSKDAVSLEQGLEQVQQRRLKQGRLSDEAITVLILDATWKYAREMEQANVATGQYPDHVIRVVLNPKPENSDKKARSSDTDREKCSRKKNVPDDAHTISHLQESFQPRRFDIRTPPSASHLSTAECIAWVVSTIENNASLYSTIMKPLDLMVEKWHSFSDNRGKKRSFTDGDGDMNEPSTKKLDSSKSKASRNKKRQPHVEIK